MVAAKYAGMAIVVLVLLALPVSAQEGDGAQRALAKAKSLLRQLQQDNAELSAANADLTRRAANLEKDLGVVVAERKELSRDLKASRAMAERLEAAVVLAQERRDEAYDRIRDLTAKLKEHIAVLKRVAAQRDVAETDAAECGARVEQCEFKNERLYLANQELLELYGAKDRWDRILQREPFTQLRQVEIESILEEYRQKLSESRVGSGS